MACTILVGYSLAASLLSGLAAAAGALGLLAACGQPSAPAAATSAPPASTAAPAAAKPTAATGAAPTAAAAASPAAAAKTGGAKLVAWGWQSFTPEGDTYQGDAMKKWASDTGNQVEYDVIENSAFPQKLAAAIEAKALPDVIMLTGSVLFYQAKNILVDLTDLYNQLKGLAGGMYETVLPLSSTADGKVWGIPFEVDTSPMFTRLDLMEKATGKREAPKTLDDLENVGKKINSPPDLYAIGLTLGRTPDCEGNTLDIIWNDGGVLVNKDGTKPALESQETINAVKRIKRWWDEKLIPPDSISWDDTGNNNAYQSKHAAVVINPASIYGWMVQHDQELLNNTEMAPIPAGTAGSYSGVGAWSWTIASTSKYQDAAKSMVKAIMQPDVLEAVCEKVGGRWYPIYKDLSKSKYWVDHPQFNGYVDLIKGGRFDSYPAQPTPKLQEALGDVGTSLVLADMIQAVVVNNTAPEQAVSDAQKKMESIFQKHGVG